MISGWRWLGAATAGATVLASGARAEGQPAAPMEAPAATPPPLPFHPDVVLVWIVVVLVLLCVLLALVWLRNAMSASPAWSLAEALSEEADVAYMTPNGPQLDGSGTPVTISRLCASSSRLIAFLGAIIILFLFLGFGAFTLYQYGTTGAMPPVGDILKFLTGGLALFAPYAVNKLSSLGSS